MLGTLGTKPVYEAPLICGRTFMPPNTPTMASPTAVVCPFTGGLDRAQLAQL